MTAQHLTQLLQTFLDNPILLFWDRACWHRGPSVEQILKDNPSLEVVFFPVASPEMNPQEQVWKATRKAVSHYHCEPRLPELVERFEHHYEFQFFPWFIPRPLWLQCHLSDVYLSNHKLMQNLKPVVQLVRMITNEQRPYCERRRDDQIDVP